MNEATGAARWSHFPHEADIGLHGMAPSLSGAFEQAALALTAVVTDPAAVRTRQRVDLQCGSPDLELLLVDWLNAVIFEMATRGMVFGRYEVGIEGFCLRGSAWGEPVEPARHQPAVEVKGATYTALRVYPDQEGLWHAECVVDV